jgi:hypothetical protein
VFGNIDAGADNYQPLRIPVLKAASRMTPVRSSGCRCANIRNNGAFVRHDGFPAMAWDPRLYQSGRLRCALDDTEGWMTFSALLYCCSAWLPGIAGHPALRSGDIKKCCYFPLYAPATT